jgi:ubiquinone/menaquinone biosynthesis C-methylase UbiE
MSTNTTPAPGTGTADGWQLDASSADAYERYLASAFSPWAAQLVAAAEVTEGDRVLDLGCGTGIVARHAAARVRPTGRVVGLDRNPEMLRVARGAAAGIAPAVEWREGSASDLPFPAATFDAVISEQALQFFQDPVRAVGEAHRVLRRGGRAAFSVCRAIGHCPTYVVLSDALDRYVGPEAGRLMRSPFSAWSTDTLRRLFLDAGFGPVKVFIEVGALRYPSCAELLRREAASSPLSVPVARLPDDARARLIADLDTALADWVDDAGVVCPVESYVVLARSEG